MIRSPLRRALLAAALGLGVTAGLARADGQPPPAAPVSEGDAAMPLTSTPTDGVPCAPPKHKLLGWMKSKKADTGHPPLGCYANFNDYSCSNLSTELLWVFGSCRQFFGERCLKGPPPSPVPGFDPRTLTYSPPGTFPPTIVQPPCNCR